eukprot:7834221-Lingulodinium_polyedra.AAC.1
MNFTRDGSQQPKRPPFVHGRLYCPPRQTANPFSTSMLRNAKIYPTLAPFNDLAHDRRTSLCPSTRSETQGSLGFR